MKRTRRTWSILLTVVAVIAAAAVGATTSARSATRASRPNIVFVLTDDLSWNLVRFMPHVLQLQRDGLTFDDYIVSDSLCCPSRSSIFTGLFPHDTGVFSNKGADGGYAAFTGHKPDLETRTYAVTLRRRGYLTSMMGKYLNGYDPTTKHLPQGWDDWHVAGDAYKEFGYQLYESPPAAVSSYGGRFPNPPDNYLTDVLAGKAAAFVDRTAAAHRPFVLEVATFAPHAPYTAATRDLHLFPNLIAPRTPQFNTNNVDPPAWLGIRAPLKPKLLGRIDTGFRERARAVQAVDRLIGRLEATVAADHLAGNTYFVFSSDNGYHMGQHRLRPGKQTAFDTDIRVPLIVTGPDVPHGRTTTRLAQNIDLYPTFVELAGGKPASAVDGRSLVPLFRGAQVPVWRTAALVEHHGPDKTPSDPDYESGALSGNPTTYAAIRLPNAVYVEYLNGDHEYYTIPNQDPARMDDYELDNAYASLPPGQKAQLHAIVSAMASCHGAASCWAAARPG